MKQLLLCAVACMTLGFANAQIKTPSASPSATLKQTVGLTDITVEYSRPGKKDREIFGNDGLVPMGKVWRTGANAVTKVTASDAIMVGGTELPAGSYAILTMPDKASWNVHFYPYEKSSWSSYLDSEPAVIVTTTPQKSGYTFETFTIDFQNHSSESATMILAWENTVVPVEIKTKADEMAMKSIEATLAGPTGDDYYRAASYLHTTGKDLSKALDYINAATNVAEPKFWQVRTKALILADLGKKKEAIAAATLSKELAMKANNEDYVRLNEKSIAEWSK